MSQPYGKISTKNIQPAATRLNQRWSVGDLGAVYEFKIKIQKLDAPGMTDEDFEHEVEVALEEFIPNLQKRFSWIGEIYRTGRTNGWLAIRDDYGKATKKSIETIAKMVEAARRQFKRDVEASAKTGYYVDLHR